MRDRYLEVTYRKGRPFAAYLHLPHESGLRAERSVEVGPGLMVDYAPGGVALGLEIQAPGAVTLDQVNAILGSLGLDVLDPRELAPLAA